MRALEKIRVVQPLAAAKGNFAQHPTLHQMQDRPIDCRAGCGGVAFAEPLTELLGPEMLMRPEDQCRHRLTLLREAESLGGEERLRLSEHRFQRRLIHNGGE